MSGVTDSPPELARCADHGIVLVSDESDGRKRKCPCCLLDLEPNLDRTPENTHLTESEFRGRMEWETLESLVPLSREYLDDVTDHETEMWATHIPLDRSLPAGYTEQERFVFLLGYRFQLRHKYVLTETEAEETIQTLREKGYGGDG